MQQIYHPDFVRNLFDRMSMSYERMNYITSFGFSIRWRKQFLKKTKNTEAQIEVIDLLSGLGENWVLLKKKYPNASFSALDFSPKMVEESTSKFKKVFGNDRGVYCQNILENNLKANSYDIVTCAYGLKTFDDEQLTILAKEVQRILKANGQFSFVEVSIPKKKTLKIFYEIYLKRIIPVLGKLFLGNPSDYKMLWIYTENFKNTQHVAEIFENQGLIVNFESYFYGCATGISGRKKND